MSRTLATCEAGLRAADSVILIDRSSRGASVWRQLLFPCTSNCRPSSKPCKSTGSTFGHSTVPNQRVLRSSLVNWRGGRLYLKGPPSREKESLTPESNATGPCHQMMNSPGKPNTSCRSTMHSGPSWTIQSYARRENCIRKPVALVSLLLKLSAKSIFCFLIMQSKRPTRKRPALWDQLFTRLPKSMNCLCGRLKPRLEESQVLRLIRHPQPPNPRPLHEHRLHGLRHHVHMRLRIHATRNR